MKVKSELSETYGEMSSLKAVLGPQSDQTCPWGKAIYSFKMHKYSYRVISYQNYSCMYNVMIMYTVCYNDKLNFLSLPTVSACAYYTLCDFVL